MKKILIIEDNAEILENMSEIIALANYEVFTALNGKIGVETALANPPDLIVCDIMMPVLDGYGVYHLLSKHEETASIPFIFLTAKSELSDIRKGMEMGADDYITKPFDGIQLLDAIEIRLKKVETLKRRFGAPLIPDEFLKQAVSAGIASLRSDERDVNSYNRKQTIYREGQRPVAVYYVVTGKVKIARTNEDGKELITSVKGPGDYFGYADILDKSSYKEEAEALEDTDLMLIPRDHFLELLMNDAEIAHTFIRMISRNMAEHEKSLLHMAYSSVRKKVAYGLIQLLQTYRSPGLEPQVISLSRENMAQSIGIASESLVRTLADFRDEQIVDVQPGKVVILDELKLRQLSA